jgi:AraC-like DNA-binding protein
MALSSDDPLKRFPVFQTTDPDVLANVVTSVFGATKLDLKQPDKLDVRGNFARLGDIALAFGAINTDVSFEYPEADYVRLQIALRGRASTIANRQETAIEGAQACITSAHQTSLMLCEGGHQRLTLRLNEAALERKLYSIAGVDARGKLEFAPALDLGRPHVAGIRRLLSHFVEYLDESATRVPSLFVRELEQAILVGFLYATQHDFSYALDIENNSATPSSVRRVEEFVEAHWNQPISAEAMAREAGANLRAVYRAFQQSRGYSPMAFVKQIRLKHAKAMLISAGPETTVTAVAFACGFASLSHFARDYKRNFGEAPSETLGRARRHSS